MDPHSDFLFMDQEAGVHLLSASSQKSKKVQRIPIKYIKILLALVPISFLAGVLVSWRSLNRTQKSQEEGILFQQPPSSHHHQPPSLSSAITHFKDTFALQHSTPFNQDQLDVIEATRHSWSGYRKYAWGADHLSPVSRTSFNWFGLGLTILDSIDTLVLMDLRNEYEQAVEWVQKSLNFNKPVTVNCFESTIRMLGGLMSAFHLTNNEIFRVKALDIGDRLIHCYDAGSGDKSSPIPYSDVNIGEKLFSYLAESSTSEASSIQLEFRELSRISNDSMYERISFRTTQHLHSLVQKMNQSLVYMYLNPMSAKFTQSTITLGARADSYYEYLLKQYLQTGIQWLEDDYIRAMDDIRSRLLQTTAGKLKLVYPAELFSFGGINPKMDHLVCFLPGTLALGWYANRKHGRRDRSFGLDGRKLGQIYDQHLQMAKQIGRTCYHMYNHTETGLAPEIIYFGMTAEQPEMYIKSADTHNLLRPEHIESLFYLYHITGDPQWRHQGRTILNSFIKYCRIASGGFSSINNVRNAANVQYRDNQESFWTGETLKYFFLLFSDDRKLVERLLSDYVFNTEAHLIPIVR